MPGNGIGDEGVEAMSETLKVNSTLTSLNMRSEEERKEKKKEKNKEE